MKLSHLSAPRNGNHLVPETPLRARLVPLLLLLGSLACAESAAGAQQDSAVVRACAQILRHQAGDGAIVMGTNTAHRSRLVPYFSNFAALGLVAGFQETGDVRYLGAAKRWIDWFEAHMNADGTIHDYAGTAGEWKSTGDYDSTDSYAATYLDLVLAAYRAAPDKQWLGARLPAARKALSAIRLTMQPNGLTYAKPGFPVMFLMDNTETLMGLRALAEIAGELEDASLQPEVHAMAVRMEETLIRELWIEQDQVYSAALHKDGQQVPNTGRWYPDVMANLMAAGWLPFSPKHRDLLTELKAKHQAGIPAGITTEPDLGRLVWWGIAAIGAGDQALHQSVAAKLSGFDTRVKGFSNPALLGHLCRILAWEKTARTTPVTELRADYDVIIAGAGTGGFGAAMQAARLGATVLLAEETDWIGGQMTAAGVTSMDEGPKHKDRPYVLVRERGLYHEFADEVTAHYSANGISADTAYWNARLAMEPRVGQDILYKMLQTARAHTSALHVSLRSTVTQVQKHGDVVTGVTLQITTPQGQAARSIRSKVLVDATEWGDVIPLTGAAFRVGNCTNGDIDPSRAIQDLTWTAVIKRYIKGVPPELLLTNPPPGYDAAHPGFLKSLVNGETTDLRKTPWSFATFIGYRGMPNSEQPGAAGITRTHLNYNNDYPVRIRDVEDIAARESTCRNAQLKTLQLLHYLQNTLGKRDWSVANDEGYDSPGNRARVDRWLKDQPELAPYRSVLYHFPVMAYARESRRIMGLHTLTASEIERHPGTPTMFEHCVAIGDYPVDLHGSKKPELLEPGLDQPGDIPTGFGDRGMGPFAIPFECLVPVKVDGFLPAEKNISQSRLANGATRLQPSTMLIGQAAGAIAGLSVKYGLQPRDLDPALVQFVLLDAGDTLHITPFMDVSKSGHEWPAIQLVSVRGLMTLTNGNFFPAAPLTPQALGLMLEKLFHAEARVPDPVSRAEFVKLVEPLMAAQGVRLESAATLPQPAAPITRLEAAQIIAGFLEQRALARLNRQDRTLPWPRLRTPSPITAADMQTSLAADLRILVDHEIIASPDYWLSHALQGSTCDGQQVADLLKRVAKAIQPASTETQALDVCTAAGFINSPDYWKQAAVEGRQCSGEYVASVIERVGRKLRSAK